MNSVIVAHRNAETWSDKVALTMVKVMRWCMDRATGYVHKDAKELAAMDSEAARKKYYMTERKYMIRNIFLESVAGKTISDRFRKPMLTLVDRCTGDGCRHASTSSLDAPHEA